MNRRNLFAGLNAVAIAAGVKSALAASPAPTTYDDAVKLVWRPLDASGGVREIVRAGTLAANSHNTQPWRFVVSDQQITIKPDFARRCPAVDPDDHHLFASLGCAIENMMHAADVIGFRAATTFEPSSGRATIALERGQPSRSDFADAITMRQCTRADYDGRALNTEDLNKIAAAATLDGVECVILTERSRIEAVVDYVVRGNTQQLRDAAFMAELIAWLQFNDGMAIEQMDGLATRSSGNLSLPAWIGRRALPYVMTEKGDGDKYAKQIRSSAGIAVISAASNDKAGWISAGRAYQRFALQATALGIRQAFVNQPVEVASLRPQFASYLGLGSRRPDLVVRFGRGPALPSSLRRPVEAVLDQA